MKCSVAKLSSLRVAKTHRCVRDVLESDIWSFHLRPEDFCDFQYIYSSTNVLDIRRSRWKGCQACLSRANLKMKYNSIYQMKRTVGRHNVLVFRPTYSLRKKKLVPSVFSWISATTAMIARERIYTSSIALVSRLKNYR